MLRKKKRKRKERRRTLKLGPKEEGKYVYLQKCAYEICSLLLTQRFFKYSQRNTHEKGESYLLGCCCCQVLTSLMSWSCWHFLSRSLHCSIHSSSLIPCDPRGTLHRPLCDPHHFALSLSGSLDPDHLCKVSEGRELSNSSVYSHCYRAEYRVGVK